MLTVIRKAGMKHPANDGHDTPDGDAGRPTAVVTGIAAGLIGIGLVAAVLLWGVFLRPGPQGSHRAPDAVARDYFDALARGDAALALSMAETPPTATDFTSPEVLAASLNRASWAGIDVTSSGEDGDVGYAEIDYLLGGKSDHARLDMVLRDNTWSLKKVTGVIDVGALAQALPGLTLEGRPLTGLTQVEVLPGVYEFGLTAPSLVLDSPTVAVPAPGATVTPDLGLTLTDATQAQLGDAARARFNACLNEQAFMASEGCGFGFARTSSGATAATEIHWAVTSGNLDDLKFTVDPADPTHATAAIGLTLHAQGVGSDGGGFQGDQTLTHARADLTNPVAPVISFDRA